MSIDVVSALKAVSFVEVTWQPATETATVSLPFSDHAAVVRWQRQVENHIVEDLRVEGSLPPMEPGTRRLSLRPQRGLAAKVDAMSEIHVDDAAVDAAWVIHGDASALLLATLPELKRLAPYAPSIAIDEQLVLTFARLDDSAALDAALALWHRAVFFRLSA